MRLAILFLLIATACSRVDIPIEEKPYDVAYVINLDRTPERLKTVKERLCKANIPFVRFSAVDAYDITLADKLTGDIVSGKEPMSAIKKYSWAKRPILYHASYNGKHKDAEFDLLVKYRQFSAGEIGVTYSHRAIWQDIVKNNYKNAVIFEDDVILSKNFRDELKELIDNIPTDADATFIGVGRRKEKSASYPNIDNIFRDFDHVEGNDVVAKIQPTNLVYGMYAYIVGAKGAKKLLALTDRCEYPLDDIIFQQGGVNRGIIKAYVAKRKMCSAAVDNSEIKKMGRSY